jgi:uncharacterized protein
MKKIYIILFVFCVFYHQISAQSGPDRSLLKKAEKGDVTSMYNLGCFYNRQGKEEYALFWWGKAAEEGFPEAQFNLGIYYIKNNDYDSAFPWLVKSEAQNHGASAQNWLGVIYAKRHEMETALSWWLKSAAQYYAPAQFNIGAYYYNTREYDMSKVWLNRAAQQGHQGAKDLLQKEVFK